MVYQINPVAKFQGTNPEAIGAVKQIICPTCDGKRDISVANENEEISHGQICPECKGTGFLTAKVVKQ